MLYLGIDQHHKQITISLRNDEGSVIQRRQVSTRPEKTRAFLEELRRQSGEEGFGVRLSHLRKNVAMIGTHQPPEAVEQR